MWFNLTSLAPSPTIGYHQPSTPTVVDHCHPLLLPSTVGLCLSVNMAANALPIGEETRNEKYSFRSFDGREMLIWLKDLALEPCNMRPSHQKFQNQMLEVRKLLNASDRRPQRTRKFNQYEKDSKSASTLGLINREKRRRDGSSSSLSFSLFFKEKCDDGMDCCSLCSQDKALLSDGAKQSCSLQLRDFDGPITMLIPKQGNLKRHCKGLVIDSNFTHGSKISFKEEPRREVSNVLKSVVDEEFDDPSEASLSSGMENMEVELDQPPKKYLPSRSSQLPRPVIPIGPRFQAEVPKLEGTTNKRHYDCEDLKWLGTRIWPIPHLTETNTRGIGKGRSDSCSCDIRGSTNCVRKHVSEARKLLKSEIDTAFSSWKFDRMGEYVSNSWTSKEQKEFESLVKSNPLSSDDTNFWKLAKEHFPAKSMKSMVNYYYNVYIPRRMSMETRSSFGAIDSDNDQNECSTTRKCIVPIRKLLKSRITKYR